jgi:hypothetical protein
MFLMLWKGVYSAECIVFAALIIIWNAGILSTSQALAGFSNSGMLAVGTLFVVVKGASMQLELIHVQRWCKKDRMHFLSAH